LIFLLFLAACGLQEREDTSAPAPEALVFRLQASGPLERWVTLQGHEAAFERRNGQLQWRALDSSQKKRRTRLVWSNWGLLENCLGSPLRERTGGDPAAFRTLVIAGTKISWVLDFSGLNRCSLGGRVVVDAVEDRVDTAQLEVDGIPWSSGGRQRALAILRAETRDTASERWPDLDMVGRILLLKSLSDDPDPRAEDALLELKALAPSNAADIEAALERRQFRLSP